MLMYVMQQCPFLLGIEVPIPRVPPTVAGAGHLACIQNCLPRAVSHYKQAGLYGWLPLTAAYLHASQPQPALLLLQHAIARSYSSEEADGPRHAAARQMAAEWASLTVKVIRDAGVPGGLTLLLFPGPNQKQPGTSQVS